MAQVVAHGSRVFAVDGSYDDAYALCMAACAEQDWYNRSTGFNPFMNEGKKTVALEIAAQLARGSGRPFAAPDAVFVAAGDGCILGGVHKGFADLHALGLVERMPRLFGVQSDASAALHDAWRAGADSPAPVRATTRADSIRVDAPRDATKALRAVRDTGGRFVLVSDDAILDAVVALARSEGVFAEPAGAAALAGVAEARRRGWLDAREHIVAISTGSGLKDAQAALGRAPPPTTIEPSLDALRRRLPPRGRATASPAAAAG
ncbi:threonine synthase [Nannocystis pusilla]|uniref:threonine synthase n=1 Tax=Nannocystis pusilla TaxID=889268 RepID=UPI003B7D1E40